MREKFSSQITKVMILFQGAFVPLSDINTGQVAPFLTRAFSANSDFPTMVNALFKGAISVGAILAVLQLARAGFMYMGGESWGTKEKSKEIMRQASLGLLILLSIYLVLEQINPQLLDLNILNKVDPSKIEVKK